MSATRGRRSALTLAAFLAVGAAVSVPAVGQISQPPTNPPPLTPTFSSRSELVVLRVSVLGEGSRAVGGLEQDRFHVFENDVPQEIAFFSNEDQPVTVGIVVDNSGSMLDKRGLVVASGMTFAQASNPADEIFTVNINEHVRLGLPPGMAFTSDHDVLRQALSSVSARGRTGLYDAIMVALNHLRGGHHPYKVLVLLSDGGDNASETTLDEVMKAAQESETAIYAVGLFDRGDREADPGTLRQLATTTGGRAFFPKAPGDAVRTLSQIAREIRAAYTIGYEPTGTGPAGSYRRIRVTVDVPDSERVEVRTRDGYWAGVNRRTDAR